MDTIKLATIKAEQAECWVTGAAWVGSSISAKNKSDMPAFRYISLIGPPSAVTSVWASLVKRKGHISIYDWNSYYPFAGMVDGAPARRMVKIINQSPKYIHAIIVCPSPSLLLLTAPGQRFPYSDEERRPLVGPLLVNYVNTHSRTVCKPQWGDWLFKNTVNNYIHRNAVWQLSCNGDCLAYWVKPGLRWGELIEDGIRKGELK